MKSYRITDWNINYENNRTRDLKSMSWVPIQNKYDSDGYTIIMSKKDGAAIYGAWIACVGVASRCRPRGTMLRDSKTAHDIVSLSRITRISSNIIKRMLDVCTNECKWLEIIDIDTGVVMPHMDAVSPQDDAQKGMEVNGMEGNGSEWNGSEEKITKPHFFINSEFYEKEKFELALNGWEKEKINYYYASAFDYSKSKNVKYCNWVSAVKNWDRRNPNEWKKGIVLINKTISEEKKECGKIKIDENGIKHKCGLKPHKDDNHQWEELADPSKVKDIFKNIKIKSF